jgi:hypothetical protein
VAGGMLLTDILICGLVAGTGVALFCAAAAWLFDAPMGPGLLGLWDDSGRLRPLRFLPPRHPRPARSGSPRDPVAVDLEASCRCRRSEARLPER